MLMVANYRPDVGFAWWLMDNFWVELSTMARENDLEALIVYPEEGEIPPRIREARIETLIQPFPASGWTGLINTVKLIRRRRVKAVYFTDRAYTSLKYVLFRLFGVRIILNHDHTPGDRPAIRGLRGLLKSIWRRLPMMSCDLQICVAPLVQRRAIENACIPITRTAVVQNGIEPVECESDQKYAHRMFGFPEAAVICVNVGRANPYKKIDFFVQVARICVQERHLDNLFFLHCGDGPDLGRLRALASNFGIEERMVFAGQRSDIPAILCSGTFALHPARGEAFSLAIVEYMSAGLVTLVPDIPSVSQAISEDVDGVVYPDRNTIAVADHIEALMRDVDRRKRISAAAIEKVKQHYSLQTMNEEFRTVAGKQIMRCRG